MQVIARTRYIKMSPKKIRLVANLIRGLDVSESLIKLDFVNKAAALPLKKLLRSAIANAEENNQLEKNNLFIKEIKIDVGPTARRWRSRAFGRASIIRKRSSHITLILEEKVPTKQKKEKKIKDKKDDLIRVDNIDELKSLEKSDKKEDDRSRRPESKKMKSGNKGFISKVFNRKSGDK